MEIAQIDLINRVATSPLSSSGQGTNFAGLLSHKTSSSETDLGAIFAAAAKEYQVPESLLKAVAKAESNFRADATSSCGAIGVMQLMPGTARSLGVTNPYDPEQNIMGGAKYLSGLLEQFDGNVSHALAAYNAGPGNVKKYHGIPPFPETQHYVSKVLSYCDANLTAGSVQGSAQASLSNILDLPSKESVELSLDRYLAQLRIQLYEAQRQLLEPEEPGTDLPSPTSVFL